MNRLIARLAALVAAVTLVACIELSGPGDGVFSIEPLQLPSPGIARGDSIRDTLGRALPPTVIARDKNGNVIDTIDARFFTLDRGVTVLPGGFLRGDSLRSDARIVGEVGGLQTLPVPVDVVVPPVRVVESGATTDTITFAANAITDSLSSPFGLSVRAAGDTAVASWLVRFTIVASSVVPRREGVVPVTIVDATVATRIDTTDASGNGLRQLRVTPLFMDEARLAQRARDSVTVRVSAVVGTGRDAHVVERDFKFYLQPQ